MIKNKRIIVYELNEVPKLILADFVAKYKSSTLARIYGCGTFYETLTEDSGPLSPWITWPTLHRGVSNDKHGIADFGQDLTVANEEYPSYLSILSRSGRKVGVFGSLHTYPLPSNVADYAFYLPDTFANGSECFPESLRCFQDFNLRMVDSSGRNVSRSVLLGPAATFLAKAYSLGLTLETSYALARQLIVERFLPIRTVRRRTSQTELAFDLFFRQLEMTRPDICTFFTNHVASSMHRYWPAKYPEDYADMDLGKDWRAAYGDEIDFTMRIANKQLDKLVAFVERNKGYVLVIASSMGQSAVTDREIIKSQLYVDDFNRFMLKLGLNGSQWDRHRTMLPRYVVKIEGNAIQVFKDGIGEMAINGVRVPVVDLGHGIFQFELGQPNLNDESTHVTIRNSRISVRDAGLVNMKIEDESGSYAYHIPEGILLVYDPARPQWQDGGTISSLRVAPTILENFEVAPPSYMQTAIV